MDNPAPGFRDHPDHSIILDTGPDPVTVMLGGDIVAMTTSAIVLREDGHPVRAYIPKGDIGAALSPTDKTTHCPFKGDTVYFDVKTGNQRLENAAWAYEHPYDEMAPLAGHVAFDDRFEIKIG